jgi:tRNA A-37 threonylcarbamoyl transferase component Bud32
MSFNSKTRATVLARAVHAPGKPHFMVKCYSVARPRDAEVRRYQALESMQGKKIPILIEAEYAMPDWFAKMVGKSFKFAMVLSFISDNYRIHSFLLTEYMEVCRKLVQRMHVLGVSHGNPIDENILYNKEKDEAVIFDFRKGCTLARVGKKKILEACNEDMDIMDTKIEMYEGTWGSSRSSASSGTSPDPIPESRPDLKSQVHSHTESQHMPPMNSMTQNIPTYLDPNLLE